MLPTPSRPRETALIAAVLDTLEVQLHAAAQDSAAGPRPDVQQLIASAVAEIQRLGSPYEQRGSVAPVLGSGVVHGLIKQRLDAARAAAVPPHDALDERR